MNEKIIKNSKLIFTITIVIHIIFSLIFFRRLHYNGHDSFIHYNRLQCLIDSFVDGNFLNYMDYYIIEGYGYLIKLFYCDFLFIPFAFIGYFTSTSFAYITMTFVLTLLTSLFMYKAMYAITERRYPAYIASLIYTFSTYRIIDIYFRSAMGEVFALAFIPLIVWGSYEIINGNYKKWYILAIGFSLLIYSHVISSILTFVFLIIFLLIYNKNLRREPKRFYYLLLAGIICVVLSSYYLIPFIEQLVSNNFRYELHNDALYPDGDLIDVLTNLFNASPLPDQDFQAKLGLLVILPLIFRIFVKETSRTLRFFDICAIAGVICIVITASFFPWNVFPFKLFSFIQFPFRLYIISSLLLAMSGAYYLSLVTINNKQRIISYITLFTLSILFTQTVSINCKNFMAKIKGDDDRINKSSNGASGAEYLPAKIPTNSDDKFFNYADFFLNRGGIVKPAKESTIISNFDKMKGHITFDAEVTNNDNLELPLTYYKGYKATLDGETIEYQQSESGLIEIPINESGKVEVEYVGTILQKISWYVTIVSIILLSIFVIANRKKQTKQEKI